MVATMLQPNLPRACATLAAAPVVCHAGQLTLPTHPFHNAMRRGLLVPAQSWEEQVKLRVNGKTRIVRVHSWFPLAAPSTPPRDANLLKTHLDLVDQAYRRSPRGLGFWYDVPAALERMGYKRLEGGGFHPDTSNALVSRLGLLSAGRVKVENQEEAPYWRFFVQGDDGALVPLEAAGPGRGIRRVLAVPGTWWSQVELGSYRLG
jgi:hypothetical protein